MSVFNAWRSPWTCGVLGMAAVFALAGLTACDGPSAPGALSTASASTTDGESASAGGTSGIAAPSEPSPSTQPGSCEIAGSPGGVVARCISAADALPGGSWVPLSWSHALAADDPAGGGVTTCYPAALAEDGTLVAAQVSAATDGSAGPARLGLIASGDFAPLEVSYDAREGDLTVAGMYPVAMASTDDGPVWLEAASASASDSGDVAAGSGEAWVVYALRGGQILPVLRASEVGVARENAGSGGGDQDSGVQNSGDLVGGASVPGSSASGDEVELAVGGGRAYVSWIVSDSSAANGHAYRVVERNLDGSGEPIEVAEVTGAFAVDAAGGIAYVTRGEDGSVIRVIDPDGSVRTVARADLAGAREPVAIARDGNDIAWIERSPGAAQDSWIYVMRPGEFIRIAARDVGAKPSLSLSGRLVAWAESDERLGAQEYLVDLELAQPVLLGQCPGCAVAVVNHGAVAWGFEPRDGQGVSIAVGVALG